MPRRASRGQLVPVARGAYVDAGALAELPPRRVHELRARAALPRLDPRFVLSHASAAAVHGLPRLGSWPERVHVTDPDALTTTTRPRLLRHAGPLDEADVTEVHALRVTTPLRTALDLACSEEHREAVVALDDLLHRGLVVRDELLARLEHHPRRRGRRAAAAAIDAADALAESPGETLCRLVLAQLGAPVPVLQQGFVVEGRRVRVDFWFPEQGVVLEFDGHEKYAGQRLLRGRAPADVVVDEKRREDGLRRLPPVRGFVRCRWWHLVEPRRLRTLLLEAGVPCR